MNLHAKNGFTDVLNLQFYNFFLIIINCLMKAILINY